MIRRCRPFLGTYVEIRVPFDTDISKIEKAFETISLIENRLSCFNPDSDVFKINQLERNSSIRINPETFEVLSFALELSAKSGGLFDITIANTLAKRGFLPSLDYKNAEGKYSDIILGDDNFITLTQEVCIDLGGIAKGYAVDCAIKTLQNEGIIYGSVNAGGDLRVFGNNTEPLIIRHPIRPEETLYFDHLLHNNAAATSAGYYSRTGNLLPIVDPRSGQCIENFDSATILASSCMVADALTKILLIDPEQSTHILDHYQARAILIRHNQETDELNVFDSYAS